MTLRLTSLPSRASTLLEELDAPPRLRAHLTLVHDVALELVRQVRRRWPAFVFDAEAVAFGAAIHDIGKAMVREELSQPGSQHEALGERLLLERDIPPAVARFARTHAQWQRD